MLELRIMQGAHALPIFDLPARLGRAQAAREIGDTIEGMIAYLDELGGDPDIEDDERGGLPMVADGVDFVDEPTFPDGLAGSPEDAEDDDPDGYDGTEFGDVSWSEWQTRGRFKLFHEHEAPGSGLAGIQLLEDDEDDDPAEDDDSDRCAAGDDEMTSGAVHRYTSVSADPPGNEDDAEHEDGI